MIDFSYDSRADLLEDLHGICGDCMGTFNVATYDGSPEPCPNGATHKAIAEDVAFALEGASNYKDLMDQNIELAQAGKEMSQVIVEFTAKLQAIGEAAKNVSTSLDEINELVYGDFKGSSINSIRAVVLRDLVSELHYELSDRICVCGEAWSETDLCAEARRILNLADKFSGEEE